MAALELAPNASGPVADVTGSQGYRFGQGYEWSVYAYGYPSDLFQPYRLVNKEKLRYCTGDTWEIGIFNKHQGLHCDMGHGSSGGPWLSNLQMDRGWGYLVGNVSTHYPPGDPSSDEMRSPYLGDVAINLYNTISGGGA